MNVLALDWNATRIRAASGPAGEYPLPVLLEPPHADLPMMIDLQKGHAEVGSIGLASCRQAHQVCQSFLPYIGAAQGPRWQMGKHQIDAKQSCEIVWKKLQPFCKGMQGIVLAVPSYLQPPQAESLQRLGEQLKLPVLGSVPASLAAAIAGHSEQFWQNSVVIIDVDEHALTIGWVRAIADKAHLIESRSFPNLGTRFWKDRLINSLSDMFVWQHRRDPRDAPLAEQNLYDQLDVLIDASLQRRSIQLGVQSQQWFKHLLVHPQQTDSFCEPFVRHAVQETEHLMLSWPTDSRTRGILVTHQAGRLPGLVDALQKLVRPPRHEENLMTKQSHGTEIDFGDELLFQDDVEELAGVLVLPADAAARSAHALADLFRRGALPRGHLETIIPLPAPQPADSGPARVHFQGRDYILREKVFVLGSQYGCHLCFDRERNPEIAARHCEIIFDHRTFILHNLCREGTLVNDQPVAGSVVLHPGDRVRLGYRGPVVRFLGRAMAQPVQAAHV